MDGLRIARIELDRSNVPALVHGYRHDERAKHVRTVAPQLVAVRHGDDEIGSPQPPAGSPLRRGREIRRVASCSPLGHPASDQRDVVFRQTSDVCEVPMSDFRFPRRHVPARRDFDNLRGALERILICEEAEWSNLIRTVAPGAGLEKDGRDVLVERDRGGCLDRNGARRPTGTLAGGSQTNGRYKRDNAGHTRTEGAAGVAKHPKDPAHIKIFSDQNLHCADTRNSRGCRMDDG